MTTVQHFLRWLKERSSKRPPQKEKDDEGVDVDPSDPRICPRAFMKLPPIPRDVTLSPDISRDLCETPSYHVYEEIPYDSLDRLVPLESDHARPGGDNLDISELDFKRAKDFGDFLVVPMRGHPHPREGIRAERVHGHLTRGPEVKRCSPRGGSESADSGVSSQGGDANTCRSQWRDPKFKWIYHDGSQAPAVRMRDGHPPPPNVCPRSQATRQHTHLQTDPHHTPHDMLHNPASDSNTRGETQSAIEQNTRPHSTAFTNRMCLGVAALKDPIREQLLHKSRSPIAQSTSIPEHLIDSYLEYELHNANSDSGINSSQTTKLSFSDSDLSGVYAMSSGDSLQSHNSSGDGSATRVPKSDSSNDTFSEYDIKSDDSLIQDELYDFYLSKVRDNMKLKEHVQQIIRSETESSDCEGEMGMDEDNVSLTTVTSMSESSLADEEIAKICAEMHRLNKEIRHSSPKEGCDTHKTRVSKDAKQKSLADSGNKVPHKRTKRSKKDSKGKTKPVECYKLPEFPQQPGSAFQVYRKRPDSQSSVSSELDMTDKLSCRATKYQPPSKPKTSKQFSATHGSSSRRQAPPGGLSSAERTGRNKLLSDLMRLNHDRQLMALM